MNSTSFGPITLIVDPAAVGSVKTLEMAMKARGLEGRLILPEAGSDAAGITRAAAEAIRSGDRYIVAVGGDTTVHRVVNALFDPEGQMIASDVVIGTVPAPGFSSDLTKTFGLPEDMGPATAHLMGEEFYGLDLVRATVASREGDGTTTTNYFAIVAEIGLGALQVAWESRMPNSFGRGGRFVAFWASYLTARSREVAVSAGRRKNYEGPSFNVIIGNCQFFGGGLRISPRSYPGDGVLDILISKGPKSDAYTTIPKMFMGEHLPSDHVEEFTGKIITVDSPRKPMLIHADGEIIGTTPATFEVIPQAVKLKV